MKPYYLYKIVNQINNKMYIGITSQPKTRKQAHFSKRGHTAFSILKLAMDKYGRENFTFEIICIGDKEYILDLEVKAISLYKTQQRDFGYNIKSGGQSGRGYSVGGTKRDVPVFVSGWWFPNRRTAVAKLNISVSVYKNRKKRGTLGFIKQDYQVKPDGGVIKFSRSYKYYSGFWFPSLYFAAKILNLNESTVITRYNKGYVEQEIPKRITREQSSEKNHMFGIHPKDHPSAVAVIIEGKHYHSLKEATEDTGYSKYIINQRIKQNHPDFKYA